MVASTSSRRQRRRRAVVAMVATIALVSVIVLLLRGGTRSDRQPTAATETEPPPSAAARALPALPHTSMARPIRTAAGETEAPKGPIIDDVLVEKQEVCEGEENLITVKAHTPDGADDAFLHYFVGTAMGQAVPIRGIRPAGPGERRPPMQIRVFGRNNVTTTIAMPQFTVKKCKPERMLLLRTHHVMNTADQIEIVAAIRELGTTPRLEVASYRWTFGDGSAEESTTVPVVRHRFVPQDANGMFSNYLVRCQAVGKDGRTVVGRHPLQMPNLEFENLYYKKMLVLMVELTPRFPALNAAGEVVQRVRLYHHRAEPVRLQRAVITHVRGDGEGAPEERTVAEILGTTEVPPGAGHEVELRLDAKARPDVLMANYHLQGEAPDGITAVASFSLMRPPPAPTPDKGQPVTDPVLAQKIRRAREALGKEFVNDEDLQGLEARGAFADLRPQVAASAPETKRSIQRR